MKSALFLRISLYNFSVDANKISLFFQSLISKLKHKTVIGYNT